MNNVISRLLSKVRGCFPSAPSEETPVETLTAFVRDTEHDMLSVITALQAHLDLFQDEQERGNNSVARFAVLNRAIARISSDITSLAVISDVVTTPRSTETQMLEGLMEEIADDTQSEFNINRVSLACSIATGISLIGSSGALKVMIEGMVLAVLHESREFETVRITGVTDASGVSLSCDMGPPSGGEVFKPWRLGALRLLPVNGQGISMAAVAALAQLHHGQLSVGNLAGQRASYRLSFKT